MVSREWRESTVRFEDDVEESLEGISLVVVQIFFGLYVRWVRMFYWMP